MTVRVRKAFVEHEGSWCACCGKSMPRGIEVVRIETDREVRLVSKGHFKIWLDDDSKTTLQFQYREDKE